MKMSRRHIALSVSAAISILLSGCGSTPTQSQVPQVKVAPHTQEESPRQPQTATQWIDHAELLERQGSLVERNQALLSAAEIYLDEQQNEAAQQILLALKSVSFIGEAQKHYHYLVARAYQDKLLAADLLPWLTPLASDTALRDGQLALTAQLNMRQGDWLNAANAMAKLSMQDQDTVGQIWSLVNRAALEADGGQFDVPANLQPYKALYELIKAEGFSAQSLSHAVNQYTQVFIGHPLVEYLPEEVINAQNEEDIPLDEVVVMLPLSGRFEQTGSTIKNGILSAYYQQQESATTGQKAKTLRFIDTQDHTPEQLVEQIGDAKILIGPLLKSNVEALTAKLPADVSMLALNRVDLPAAIIDTETQNLLSPAVAYFGLTPEDEAIQLAELMHSKHYTSPVVVAGSGSTYQRMQKAFASHWKKLANEHVLDANTTLVTFDDSDSLKDRVTEALDVAQSEARIKLVQAYLGETLHNTPRSRRDIDAIAVFANPEQTELLNPVVEASISPYVDTVVPVYASSHSLDYDNEKNQWRDLQGIHFIDMPWLLPNNSQPTLASQNKQLWPNQTTPQSRLFAMGYDAYAILPKLSRLKVLPQLSVDGLTGKIYLNQNHQIVRVLPVGKIEQEQVVIQGD